MSEAPAPRRRRFPYSTVIVLVGGILDGSLTANVPAETAASLDQAATLFATQTVGISLIAIVERALAMALHVILALLVMRIVVRGGGRNAIARRLALPIAIHASVNLVAVIGAQLFGVLVAEGLVALPAPPPEDARPPRPAEHRLREPEEHRGSLRPR